MRRAAAFFLPLIVVPMLAIAGCATLGIEPGPPLALTQVEHLEYFPYQVKGYQRSYPPRSITVLVPLDQREFVDADTPDHAPEDGKPAIGVVLGRSGGVLQRLYNDPLPELTQRAIGQSAQEAGMVPFLGRGSTYDGKPINTDYVLASKITRGWVVKRRGANGRNGPLWSTSADFALTIVVYKPPFTVPFWQGTTSSTFNDPPVGSFGLGPEDEAGIYDSPGEVLSVALTRAVAGIFQHDDFRTLVRQDQINPR